VGGLSKYVTCHISEFLFFLILVSSPGRIYWLFGTNYAPKRVFPAKNVPFGGLDNIRLHLGGETPPQKKTPQNEREYEFRSQIGKVVK